MGNDAWYHGRLRAEPNDDSGGPHDTRIPDPNGSPHLRFSDMTSIAELNCPVHSRLIVDQVRPTGSRLQPAFAAVNTFGITPVCMSKPYYEAEAAFV